MLEMKMYLAKVIDNNDTNSDQGAKLSRVKVKVLPEMNGIKDEFLPWVRPFFTNQNSRIHNPPEIGQTIWVFFVDEYWHDGYYVTGLFVDGQVDYAGVDSSLQNITEGPDLTYPNLKFYQFPDTSILFINTDTGDKGIYQANGTYMFINADGDVYLYTPDRAIQIYTELMSLLINGDNGDLTYTTDNITAALNYDGTYSITGAGTIECDATGKVAINGANLEVLA